MTQPLKIHGSPIREILPWPASSLLMAANVKAQHGSFVGHARAHQPHVLRGHSWAAQGTAGIHGNGEPCWYSNVIHPPKHHKWMGGMEKPSEIGALWHCYTHVNQNAGENGEKGEKTQWAWRKCMDFDSDFWTLVVSFRLGSILASKNGGENMTQQSLA